MQANHHLSNLVMLDEETVNLLELQMTRSFCES